ncbi:hypothetical protein, conserved in T. vivax, partial [Trypanosoma vivax Y486]
MAEVDNVSQDLTEWKNQQVAEWKEEWPKVPVWLENMKNNTGSPSSGRTNIWQYNVTIWDIIKKDCNRVHENKYSDTPVGIAIVNSARLNILRHLDDIANNATTESSIMENGCDTMYKHFRGYVSVINKTEEEKETSVKELCGKFEKEHDTMKNCTVNRTSLEWMEHRFNETVHEMVERMNNSLTQLIEVEKKVLTEVGNMVVSKRDAICNDSTRLKIMNVTLRELENERHSAVFFIHALNTSIARARSEAAKSLSSSEAALEKIAVIEKINGSHTKINQARDGYAEVERTVRQVLEIKAEAEKALNEAVNSRTELDKKSNLESALGTEENHLKTNGDKIIKAFRLLEGGEAKFDNVEKLCSANFTTPSVPIDVANKIITELANVNSSAGLSDTEEKVKGYKKHVERLKTLSTQLNEYNHTINDNATRAVKSAADFEENVKRAEKDAVETVVGEVNNKAKELCAADKKLKSFSAQIGKTTEQG